jgi:hypothetical protein
MEPSDNEFEVQGLRATEQSAATASPRELENLFPISSELWSLISDGTSMIGSQKFWCFVVNVSPLQEAGAAYALHKM